MTVPAAAGCKPLLGPANQGASDSLRSANNHASVPVHSTEMAMILLLADPHFGSRLKPEPWAKGHESFVSNPRPVHQHVAGGGQFQ